MKLLQTTALCVGMALAAPAAFAAPQISDVEVRTDLSDYESSNALDYWPNLAEDLGKAIVAQAELADSAEFPSIVVEVTNVAVDGNPVLPNTGEFNQLGGIVQVFPGDPTLTKAPGDRGTEDPIQNYPLRLHAIAGEAAPGEGWITIPPSQDDFYNAMITAFAAEVLKNMDE